MKKTPVKKGSKLNAVKPLTGLGNKVRSPSLHYGARNFRIGTLFRLPLSEPEAPTIKRGCRALLGSLFLLSREHLPVFLSGIALTRYIDFWALARLNCQRHPHLLKKQSRGDLFNSFRPRAQHDASACIW